MDRVVAVIALIAFVLLMPVIGIFLIAHELGEYCDEIMGDDMYWGGGE